jgi:predicted MFS family arabinose efflux permease
VSRSSSNASALFAVPDYRRLWVIGAGLGVARWLEFLALGVFAYQVTGSPPLVALVAIVRMLPNVFLGLVVGALADHLDRRRMLATGFLLGAVAYGVMAGVAFAGAAGYGTVILAATASGLMWTLDMPVRRRLLVDAAGIQRMTAALGFDNSTNYATRAIGPIAGGAAYQAFGIEGIFALSAAIYSFCFALCTRLKTADPPEAHEKEEARISLPSLLVPPRELLWSRRFQVVLGVTVVFNIWCFPIISMVPVLGEKEFALSPVLIGMLSASEGLGGTVGAVMIGLMAGQRPPSFQLYYFGVFAFVVLLLVMSAWLTLGVAVICLLLIGAAAAAFSATQYALVYTMSPPKLRGRAAGFMSIVIGTSTIGFYNTGFLFSRFDSANALMLMGLQGLVPIVILGVLWLRAKS